MRDDKGRFIKGSQPDKVSSRKKTDKKIAQEIVEEGFLDSSMKNSLRDLEAASAYYKKKIEEGDMDFWDKLVEVSKFKLPYEKPRISSIASQEDVVTDITVSWQMASPIADDHPLMKLLKTEKD